jgi:hypothetical protein
MNFENPKLMILRDVMMRDMWQTIISANISDIISFQEMIW